jgi:hypothetical protein
MSLLRKLFDKRLPFCASAPPCEGFSPGGAKKAHTLLVGAFGFGDMTLLGFFRHD